MEEMIQEILENFEDMVNVTLTEEMEEDIFNTLSKFDEVELCDVEIIQHAGKLITIELHGTVIIDSRDFEPDECFANQYK